MKKQLRLNLYLDTSLPEAALMAELKHLAAQSTVINPGQPNEEYSTLEIIENHHDKAPNTPCLSLYAWNNKP